MVSLAQTAIFGVAGFVAAKLTVDLGWNGWAAAGAGIGVSLLVGFVFGATASGNVGIYFLMITLAFAEITYYYFSAVPTFGAHEGINEFRPPAVLADPVLHPGRMYYFTLAVCVLVYLFLRHVYRTAFGLALQGVRDDPVRMAALGFKPRLHRTLGFALAAPIAGAAGVLSAWSNTRISAGSISLGIAILVLTAAVIGGLFRLEGAWVGALVYTLLDTYTRGWSDRFTTWLGMIFLAIVLVSPGGVVGVLTSLAGWTTKMLSGRETKAGDAAQVGLEDPSDAGTAEEPAGAVAGLPVGDTRGRGPDVSDPVLEVRNLSKRFGGVLAVRDVDLCVAAGERRVTLGPNGAGKTTLFNLIAGLEAPTTGTVALFGSDVTTLDAPQRARRGLSRTFQTSRLLSGLTVEDNLYLAVLGVSGGRFRLLRTSRDKAARRRAREAAERVGIAGLLPQPAADLSHGEQRQLEIALALAAQPRLLLLDEPAAGLSRAEREQLTKVLLSLDRDVTLLMIEHDMDVAFAVAERVTMMHEGAVIVEGTPDEVRANKRVHDLYLGRSYVA
jgi:ABC-type branched-subunit amino acid transport system ATPase component/ABC-type branched-subunit amino acid transport system permease subunit